MELGVDGLAGELGVRGVDFAGEDGFLVDSPGARAQDEDDFVLDVEAGVVVVVVFGGGDAVAGEDDGAGDGAGGREVRRGEIGLDGVLRDGAVLLGGQRILGAEFGVGGDVVALEEVVADGLEAGFLETGRRCIRRPFPTRASRCHGLSSRRRPGSGRCPCNARG